MPASTLNANILQYIAWFLALVEFILGLYVLALNPWHPSNRHASFLLLLTSSSSLLLGVLMTANDSRPANLPLLLMAAIIPAIEPWILITSIVLLKPGWLQGRWKALLQAMYGLAFLPTCLTLIDTLLAALFRTRLWFTGLPAGYTASGFIALPDYTQGILAPALRILNLNLIPILTLIPLAYVVFFDKRAPSLSPASPVRRLGRLLLITQVFAVVLELGLQSLGIGAEAIRNTLAGVNVLITSVLFSLAYAYAAFQQMISERRFQRGSLQARLTILLLTVSFPVLFALAAFLVYRLGAIVQQPAAGQQPGLVLEMTIHQFQREAWFALAIGIVLLSTFTWFTIRQSFQPVQNLTAVAKAITRGNLDRTALVEGYDEIGSLAMAINGMTEQLRTSIATLEQRVEDRTAEAERRVIQLRAAAQVAREAAAIRDLRLLLNQTTALISDRFGFYHAGIFLVDEAGEYAILQAANSPGGQRMLARGHKLQVGKVGIVGYVASTGKSRIALNVGEDAVFFNNPDLPLTRSEMALPLKARGQVIGILDVQSTKPAVFTEEDLQVLQILADQIALAIENARLLEDRERALKELEAQYGETTRRAWSDLLAGKPLAYVYNRLGVEPAPSSGDAASAQHRSQLQPVSEPTPLSSTPALQSSQRQIALPLVIHNQVLGSIVLRREENQEPWTASDYSLVEEAVNGISQALENARLFAEIQRRAQMERSIGEVAARAQASLDLETLMKTAVREVALATSAARVQIQVWDTRGSASPPRTNGKAIGGGARDGSGEDESQKPSVASGHSDEVEEAAAG